MADPLEFPALRNETVFVACPSDITALRAQIERVIRRTVAEAPGASPIVPYSWDLAFDPEGVGFDQRISIQRSIPRPSDPLCRGTIGVLSERIGTPLEDDFPLSRLPNAAEWTATDQRYRLQHPWPTDRVEQAELLQNGAFPLTGTTWEFLDAASASVPLFLAFLADRPVDPEDEELRFGNNRLYAAQAQRTPIHHRTWDRETYQPQIRALRNFAGALMQFGRDVKTFEDDDALMDAIRGFVSRQVLDLAGHHLRTPFKGLDHYDVEDGDVFFGRGVLANAIVRDVEALAEANATDRFVGVLGASGCGKSSVLRAGALYELQRLKQRGRYHVMALRPTDLQDDHGRPEAVVSRLLDIFVSSTGLRPPVHEVTAVSRAPADRAARDAVAVIRAALPDALDGSPSNLVIGLDQLEEIVDDLATEDRALAWRPLVDFITEAVQGEGRILFVYTLELGRIEGLESTPLARFCDELHRHRVANGPEFWHDVISLPFRAVRMPLQRQLALSLRRSVSALTQGKTEDEVSALLPLVSMALSRIHDHAEKEREKTQPEDRADRFAGAQTPFELAPEHLNDEHRDLGAAIALKADEALADSDREYLATFLRPLVQFSAAGTELVTLPAAAFPKLAEERKIAKAFLDRRLLVPVGGIRVRLVHEALLRNWDPAKKWLDAARAGLRVEEELRSRARAWDSRGRPTRIAGASEERIGQAAEVLASYLRPWSGRHDEDLTEEEARLRDYCFTLLRRSKKPSSAAKGCPYGNTHAMLAAAFERPDLLKVFARTEPACLTTPRGSDERTPLFSAAFSAPACVRYLLDKGVSPSRKTKDGFRPLHAAVYGGQLEIFEMLLPLYRHRELLDGPEDSTMLHHAAHRDQAEMVGRLLKEGLDPDANGPYGTPLAWASTAPDAATDAAMKLAPLTDLTLGDQDGHTPLHAAAALGRPSMVEILLRHADPNLKVEGTGPTALQIAALRGHAAVVRQLLAHPRLDPNLTDSAGATPLGVALERGEVRRLLLADARLDPLLSVRMGGPPAIALCIDDGDWPLLERMLDRIEPARNAEFRPEAGLLQLAMKRDAPERTLERLAKRLAPVLDAPDTGGITPLMHAASESCGEAVALLLRNGADPGVTTPQQGSALLAGLKHRADPELLERLATGAPSELEQRDEHGWTLLHGAAVAGSAAGVDWVLGRGGAQLSETRDAWRRRPRDLAPAWLGARLGGEARADTDARPDSWQGGLEWKAIDDVSLEDVLASLPEDERGSALDSRTKVEAATLSFYPAEKVRLMRLSNPSRPKAPYAYLFEQHVKEHRRFLRLAGESLPIHEANQDAISLDEGNALDYLRFFCFFLRGEEGPYLITESVDQPEIPVLSSQKRVEVARVLRPARSWHKPADSADFRASAIVYYGTNLFFADFRIQPDGMIEMIHDLDLQSMPSPPNAPLC